MGFGATQDMSAAGISRNILEVIEPLQLDPSLLIQAGDGHLSPLPPSLSSSQFRPGRIWLSVNLSLSLARSRITLSTHAHTELKILEMFAELNNILGQKLFCYVLLF